MSTSPPNLTEQWKELKEHNNKLLDYYNTIIKPTLLEFYKLTGEELETKIDYHNNLLMTLRYRDDTISFSMERIDPTNNKSQDYIPESIEYNSIYIHGSELGEQPNIRVVRFFYEHWDKVLEDIDLSITLCNAVHGNIVRSISKEH